MAKFLTRFGSYTLVLKPKGMKPVYDHTGKPVRVEGVIYCDFVSIRGSSVGLYETEDALTIEALRACNSYNKEFTEVKDDGDIPLPSDPKKNIIKLSKSALMACNKNELIPISKQYNIMIAETDTKNELLLVRMVCSSILSPFI